MADIHVEKTTMDGFDNELSANSSVSEENETDERLSDADVDQSVDSSVSDEDETDERLSDADADQSDDDGSNDGSAHQKSGMANVIAKILAKDTSSSNKALLAKGKTNREILKDIVKRRKERGEKTESEDKKDEEDFYRSNNELMRIEKKKLWEAMSRRRPSEMDVVKEIKLRRIATQGMVQLFQSVHEHQNMLNQKLASVGPSERKKDKVEAEFTKGTFLDLLKNKGPTSESKAKDQSKSNPKWKILQDDFMMGARMKDWDKDDDDSDDGSDNIEGGNAYSSKKVLGNGHADYSDDD